MSHQPGHALSAIRRIPSDTSLPATLYQGLCQCGWTTSAPLRVVVEDAQRYHCGRSDARRASDWVCPCGAELRTRRLRQVHIRYALTDAARIARGLT